jgi:hypothetical protein
MRACEGRAALKTGAEGVFVGILPEQGLGIALKITDGATRASEAVIASLLVRLGVLDGGTRWRSASPRACSGTGAAFKPGASSRICDRKRGLAEALPPAAAPSTGP